MLRQFNSPSPNIQYVFILFIFNIHCDEIIDTFDYSDDNHVTHYQKVLALKYLKIVL